MTDSCPRRTALRVGGSVVVGLLAGCTSPGDAGESSTPTTSEAAPTGSPTPTGASPTATETPPTTRETADPAQTTIPSAGQEASDLSGQPFTRLVVDTLSSAVPFRHDATLVRTSTADHPPRLRLSLTNVTDAERSVAVSSQALPFVPAASERPDDTGTGGRLVLTNLQEGSRTDGCWVLAVDDLGRLPMQDRRTLAPGETIRDEYDVFADPDDASCWPPGPHRFVQRYVLDPEGGATSYEWGFTLVV